MADDEDVALASSPAFARKLNEANTPTSRIATIYGGCLCSSRLTRPLTASAMRAKKAAGFEAGAFRSVSSSRPRAVSRVRRSGG